MDARIFAQKLPNFGISWGTMTEILICDLVDFLDYLDDLVSFCIVLCACHLDVGIICVFCTLFRLPNLGQGYNGIALFVIVIILLCAICLVTCASLGMTCSDLPLVSHTDFIKKKHGKGQTDLVTK